MRNNPEKGGGKVEMVVNTSPGFQNLIAPSISTVFS